MTTIGYTTTFDAAHKLFNYEGKCARLHGHTWTVTAEFVGEIQSNGMVADFHDVKKILDESVGIYDHQDLTQFFGQPTAENIALRIFDNISTELFRQGIKDVAIATVTVYESPHSYVRVG
jgi:6-pyruvoyltetrahydropterin/6-carboxytetrahydropterin synthase